MQGRALNVGLVGTFDVENYGDLLFPLIAETELAERLGPVELHCFSYEARPAESWPFPVISVTELPRLAAGLDGLLIGGGFLVRFDKAVAPGYGPPPGIHHPTGYWLSPALIAHQHGVPVLWNAPGVHYEDLPAWADPLMELAFSSSSYIAVRDEPSRAALARFADPVRIEVVPDTAFGLARQLAGPPAPELERVREAAGLTGPYLIIQGVRNLGACQRFLKRHADRLRGYRLLALPIGPVNSDDTSVLDPGLPGLATLPFWPHPLLMAGLIREAETVIGSSFHLAITALTAGVPVFSPVDLSLWKYPGLQGFETIHPLPAEGSDPEWFFSRLGRKEAGARVGAAVDRLAVHWDRIASVLQGGRTNAGEAVGRFWQSLPEVLESAALRHQNEVGMRDRRIADLEESTSWKVTAPFRFVGRRLGR
ncbi:MAG: polysaccharide pyruvyl transferase family protein [Acidobacteriota bacterium]